MTRIDGKITAGMAPVWRMPGLLLREWRAPAGRPRVPEPMVMEEEAAVAGFEDATDSVQGLVAVYEVSARAVNELLPAGGQVVDLGCGSGGFLRYLAQRRRDCRIIGLDLSVPMIERARVRVDRAGLGARVTVERGDATAIADGPLPERIDVLTCLNLLHQFPDVDTLDRCLQQIASVRERHGCAVWILDLVRLRHPATLRDLLAAVEPRMDAASLRNTLESEAAAFTVTELRSRLHANGLGDLRFAGDRVPGLWQAHWSPQASGPLPGNDRWVGDGLPLRTRVLAGLFSGLPPRP